MRKISLEKRSLSFALAVLMIISSLTGLVFIGKNLIDIPKAQAAVAYKVISYHGTTGQGAGVTVPSVNGHVTQRREITGHAYVAAIFGTQGWASGGASFNTVDYRCAFDGTDAGGVGSYFDGYVGGHVGVEFHEPQIVSQVVYRGRQNTERLNGAVLEGSNDGTNYTPLLTLTDVSTAANTTKNVLNSDLKATTPYKFYRVFGSSRGDMFNIQEIWFYSFADGTDIFDVLSIPDTMVSGETLLSTILGETIGWSADKADMLNGSTIVARPFTTELKLTAKIGNDTKDFNITVTGILDGIVLPVLANGSVLPNKSYGSDISWTSSDPSMLADGSVIKAKAFNTPVVLTAAFGGQVKPLNATITGILDGIVLPNEIVTGYHLPTASFGEPISWECVPSSLLVDGVIVAVEPTTVALTARYGTDSRLFQDVPVVLVPPITFTGNEWNTNSSTNFIFSLGGENPRSNYYLYDTEAKALDNFTLYPFADEAGTVSNSANILSLNGTWKFKFSVNPGQRPWPANGIGQEPRDFNTLEFDASAWDDIAVPNSWQVNFNADGTAKYDQVQYVNSANAWSRYAGNNTTSAPAAPTNINGVGTYQRHFTVPTDWAGKEVFLNFDGVSACYIWINGRAVGWTTDIWTHHELNVTPFIKAGDNVIALQLIRWTSGSWLENQDMLRLSGVARKTYLMARNKEDIWDFEVSTKPVSATDLNNGRPTGWTFDLKAAVRDFSNPTKTSGASKPVYYKLYDAAGVVVAQGSDAAEYKYVNFVTSSGVAGTNNATTAVLPFGGGVRYTATPEITGSTNISLAIPQFTATLDNPHLWSDEDPYLYKLVVYVDNGAQTEYACTRIGFRYNTYVNATNSHTITNGVYTASAGSYWLVNGKRLTFYGTNLHETNPDAGYTMTLDLIRQDLMIMKRTNVNSIRMSHYPHDTRFYDVADELGLYVMDEANHESHGNTAQSTTAIFFPTLRDRSLNMFERDKNMTCVVAWSAGNESAMSATSAPYSIWTLKARENELNGPTGSGGGRPTHAQYAQAYADMWAGMYPSFSSFDSPSQNKIMINCEYSHAMGSALGNMDTYVAISEGNSYSAGGFIWDWVDQSIRTPVPPSTTITGVRGDRAGDGFFFGYDGDWGNLSGDLDFNGDGVIFADRTLKPHTSEARRLYQRLKVSANGAPTATSVGFDVKNSFMFTNANDYDMTWQLYENGTAIREGSGVLDVPPEPYAIANAKNTVRSFTQGFEAVTPKPGAEYFFNIQFHLRTATAWAEKGYVVAASQLPLTTGAFAPIAKPIVPTTMGQISVVGTSGGTAGTIEITGPNGLFAYKFDKSAGTFTDMSFKGRQFATLGFEPNFYMPLTDNQYGEGTNVTAWKNTGSSRTQSSTTFSVATIYSNYVEIVNTSANTAASAQNVTMTTTYKIYPTGEVNVNARYVFGASASAAINVVGGYMKLVPGMENITYFARGPESNYVDRKTGTDVGLYSTTVSDSYTEHLSSQDEGEHQDTRWAAVTDDTGFGVIMKAGQFTANNLFTGNGSGYTYNHSETAYNMANLVEFNALHYSPTQFGDARQKHPYQVYDQFGRNDARLPTYMYVDIASRGRGADTSWGSQATPKACYIINVAGKTVNYNFSILPIDNFNAGSAMTFSKTRRSAYQNAKDLMPIALAAGVPSASPAYTAAGDLAASATEFEAINTYNALYSAFTNTGAQVILAFYDAAGKLISSNFSSDTAAFSNLADLGSNVAVPPGAVRVKAFYWGADFIPFYPSSEAIIE